MIFQNDKTVDSLKLGLMGLPEAESNLIATLFRLHRVERSFIWTLRSSPPFDALLVDSSLTEQDIRPLSGKNTSIMRLSAPGEQTEGELPRPIRSDRLVSWLNSIEVGLLHGGHDAFASTASFARQEALPLVDTGARQKALTPEVTYALATDSTLIFKLKRWPPPAVMAQEVERIRIATILSRRPISLRELAAISRVEESQCDAFIKMLSQHQLLSVSSGPAAPRGGLVTEKTAETQSSDRSNGVDGQAHQASVKTRMTLIQSIRRRFGLL